ncbi:MAG: hypothetical protein HYY93_03055 [Planctomycetes bacterium]|nr:hypothetical protein [Planctomycetota bacterium]
MPTPTRTCERTETPPGRRPRSRLVPGLLLLLLVAGVIVERLIVTDREAIAAEEAKAADALGRGDILGALHWMHSGAVTQAGDAAATRKMVEASLKQTPLKWVNWQRDTLVVENGVGRMRGTMYLIPADSTGLPPGRLLVQFEWEKDGGEWRVKRAKWE